MNRVIGVVAVLALAALMIPAVAAISDGSEPRPPAALEVDAYALQARIASDEAARRLAAQRRIPVLVTAAKRELGDSFGGVWVADESARPITLGVNAAGEAVPSGLRERAEAVIRAAGLTGAARWVHTKRSERELLELQASLEHELRYVNLGAVDYIDVVVDSAAGTVDMLVPKGEDQTKRQKDFLRDADDRLAPAVRLRAGPGPLRLE